MPSETLFWRMWKYRMFSNTLRITLKTTGFPTKVLGNDEKQLAEIFVHKHINTALESVTAVSPVHYQAAKRCGEPCVLPFTRNPRIG